jgi:hypothetical protein
MSTPLTERRDYVPVAEEIMTTQDAEIWIEMRQRTYRYFLRELQSAVPHPMPAWAVALGVRWFLESIRT